jgi:hypothetical protein
MVLYPIAYLILSLPIAAGRMALLQGTKLSVTFWSTAGAIIASSGFVDVLVYAITRKALLLNTEGTQKTGYSSSKPPSTSRRYGIFHTDNPVVTVSSSGKVSTVTSPRSPYRPFLLDRSQQERHGSTDNMVNPVELGAMGRVYQHTTIEIIHQVPDRYMSVRGEIDDSSSETGTPRGSMFPGWVA